MEEDIEDPLVQRSPQLFTNIFLIAIGVISTYGWFILLGSIVGIYFWKSYYPKLERWREDAERHKNPDKFIERELSVAAARQRMQEKHDELTRTRAEKLKEEEARRIERRNEASSNLSLVSSQEKSNSSAKSTKPRLRPEFNPLMSNTNSCGFRPGSGRRRMGGG